MSEVRLINYRTLREKKGIVYTRQHLLKLMKEDRFPLPRLVAGDSDDWRSRRIAWLESEIDDWIKSKPAIDAATLETKELFFCHPGPGRPRKAALEA